MASVKKNITDYYPFTLPGSIVFFLALYLLGRGFASNNYTAVSVSSFFLFFVLALTGIMFFRAKKAGVQRTAWKSEGTVYSTCSTEFNSDRSGKSNLLSNQLNKQTITVETQNGMGCPLFSRYSVVFTLRGKISGGISPFFVKRYRSERTGVIKFSWNFPWPGYVSGQGKYFIEDIFGLVKIKLLQETVKEFPILPGINPDAKINISSTVKDFVTAHRKHDNDLEKYYMREYVPGDLYRDINWKSSGRIGKLVTRISPGGKDEANIFTFVYLSASNQDKNKKCYDFFLKGKYLREYFYTFMHRLKTEAESESLGKKCRIDLYVDGQMCSIKETSDFFQAGKLLSASVMRKEEQDFSFLQDISSESSVTFFAENKNVLSKALREMNTPPVAVWLPEVETSSPDSDGKNGFIPIKIGDFAFASLYIPLAFYVGMFFSFFAVSSSSMSDVGKNKNQQKGIAVKKQGGRF